MNQLSEKELSALNDSLSEEELLVKKFQALGQQATDPEIKEEFNKISAKHQQHFNMLYKQLG